MMQKEKQKRVSRWLETNMEREFCRGSLPYLDSRAKLDVLLVLGRVSKIAKLLSVPKYTRLYTQPLNLDLFSFS